MSSSCPACGRLNPVAARYCFHDGVPLLGSQQGGPIAIGSRPFIAPFIFPNGRACKNFDEFALACEDEWEQAREMLREGFFVGFLGGVGRADLALAARQASKEPDPDRALDEFLARLPIDRTGPIIGVSPREVNLGQLDPGQQRTFTLAISNQGGGLLSGTARSDAAWIALGDAPGSPDKLFRCRGDVTMPVQIRPAAMRAGKPQEGHIVLDDGTNSVTVVVRASRPVIPFRQGKLAGAITPRQLAEKARDHYKEVGSLFESGVVAKWYESNGWTYPVQGPAASGTAAVQQFFEALGLTRPPKVTISQSSVEITGMPGGSAEHVVTVETPENRPVYARAHSETEWLQIGKVKLGGASARVPLRVPSIPQRPGQRLRGRAIVIANGNQRFVVDVYLQVHGTPTSSHEPPPVRKSAIAAFTNAPIEVVSAPVATVREIPLLDATVEPVQAVPAVPVVEVVPIAIEPPRPVPILNPAPVPQPIPVARAAPMPPPRPAPPPQRYHAAPAPPVEALPPPLEFTSVNRGMIRHLLAPLLILLLLLGTVIHDLLLGSEEGEDGPVLLDKTPLVEVRFHEGDNPGDDLNPPPPPRGMTFGLHVLNADKRLMFDALGRTNNVCIRVDGREFLLGAPDVVVPRRGGDPKRMNGVGHWVQQRVGLGKDRSGRQREGARSVWRINGVPEDRLQVEVTQTVEVVPGEQSGRLDTALVRYTLHNRDAKPRMVGIRFLLDTYIGNNDGVPFTIPGQAGLCSTQKYFGRPEDVPDYIQALEREDLLNPGTVAHLQFRLPGELESPSRVFLGGYPDGPLRRIHPEANAWFTTWDVPRIDIREIVNLRRALVNPPREPMPDSAVTIYWDEKELRPNVKREVGFSYGLGEVASGEGEGKLLLTIGGRTVRGGVFTVAALRANPVAGEKLTLRPQGEGLELLSAAEQQVPPVAADAARPISTVTWRLRGDRMGRFAVVVESSAGLQQRLNVRIYPPRVGILD